MIPTPPPPPLFRTVSSPDVSLKPPIVADKGPDGALLLELIRHNGSPFNDHWAYFIGSNANPSIGMVLEAIGDVRSGFQLQIRRNHDLASDPPSSRIPLQWIDGTFLHERVVLHGNDNMPACSFEETVCSVRVPEKTLNTGAPPKKVMQRNCQTWIVESADKLVEDGILSSEVAAYLYSTKQV
ncbi:hypothetical protein F53441_11737 [Fusarium austroafricanum]|uniref:Uncharacterized protein n=1 Tax=Fusarium austroafricanum TaxID=2364996 RepID=A0A8H4K2L9_9HYPO|nr:hypothetical protein F53441_11737 [Fusarium austroafricanum]